MKLILVFVEGDFETILTCPTLEEAKAFCEGAQYGAGKYGGGGLGLYPYPDGEEEMRDMESPSAIDYAMAAVKAHQDA